MDRKEAAPCPACGNKRLWYVKSVIRRFKKYHIECPNCDYRGKEGITVESAVRKWNNERG